MARYSPFPGTCTSLGPKLTSWAAGGSDSVSGCPHPQGLVRGACCSRISVLAPDMLLALFALMQALVCN